MRSRIVVPVAAILMAGFLVPAALAQRSSAQERQWLLVVQYVVEPSKTAEFESVAKQAVAQLAKQKWSDGFLCTRTDEVTYTFIMPAHGLREGRAQLEALVAAGQALGADWAQRGSDAVEYVNTYLVVARPDLSYQPENPRLSMDEIRAMHFDFNYLNFGSRSTAEETAKQYVNLHKKANCDTGFTVYEVVGGDELPIMIVASNAKSVADYYENAAKVVQALGPDLASVAKERDSVVRRIEHFDALVVPELSYRPASSAGGAN